MKMQALLALAVVLSSVPAAVGAEPATPVFNTTAFGSVEVAGIRIAYREAGPRNAPTILLLHGFPSSSRMFTTLIPLLADRFHLIAPDYPGFGQSDAPPPEVFAYTFDRIAAVVDGFTQALRLTRYALGSYWVPGW